MKQNVNKIEFWKERIDNAKREQYSVYLANDTLWKNIYNGHKNTILKLIKPTEKVLDAGCGYGRMAVLFQPNKYIGVDFSPDFINLAKDKFPIYNFEVVDLKKLPYKDKEFDWSICVSIKNMIENYESREAWEQMEKELKRVSKKVLILEYTNYEEYEIL